MWKLPFLSEPEIGTSMTTGRRSHPTSPGIAAAIVLVAIAGCADSEGDPQYPGGTGTLESAPSTQVIPHDSVADTSDQATWWPWPPTFSPGRSEPSREPKPSVLRPERNST
jgi:hypothetical protein